MELKAGGVVAWRDHNQKERFGIVTKVGRKWVHVRTGIGENRKVAIDKVEAIEGGDVIL